MGATLGKYYYFNKRQGLWIVQKKIHGRTVLFGTYKTEEEAARAVELFNKYGWSKENIWKVKAEAKNGVRV